MQLTTRRAILLYTIVPVIVIFGISAASGVTFLKSRIESQVNEQMTKVASGYANGLNYILRRMAGETQRTADTLQALPDLSENELYDLLRLHVGDDPVIYGAAVAFKPYGYHSERRLFSPYVFHSGKGIEQIDIGEDSYDYTDGSWEWWSGPSETGTGVWTEPYLDEGAGNILMTTYSTPFLYPDGRFRGVVTLDIGLEALRDKRFKIGHEQFALVSRHRNFLYHFNADWIGRSVGELIEQAKAMTGIDTSGIANKVLSGGSGGIHIPVRLDGDTAWLFYAPVESSGWTLGLWMSDSNTFEVVRHNLWRNMLFLCLFLLLLSVAVFRLSKRFSEPMEALAEQCRRMERLNFQPATQIASNILEMKHLASTLERMRQALFSVSSVREDIRIAKSIRKQTLPSRIPQIGGFDIQVFCQTSQEVGGEAYDIIEYPERSVEPVQQADGEPIKGIALMVVDTAGFGLEAVVTDSQLRAIFRSSIRMGIDIREMACAMNQYLSSDVSSNGLAEAWCGTIEKETSRLTYLSLGKMPAVHFVARDGTIRRLENHHQQLGSGISARIPQPATVELTAGDIVVLVSGGVVSALDKDRTAFGVAGIRQVIEETSVSSSAADIAQALTRALEAHTAIEDASSELTIAVIKCTG